jgi:TRAP-type C4-dicarboxylate transport system permease small subunit
MLRTLLETVRKGLSRFSSFACITSLASITVIVFLQVYFRYVAHSSIPWTEEISKFIMVWMAMLASYLALVENEHVKVDVFTEKYLPPKIASICRFLSLLIILTFCIFNTIVGWKWAWRAWPQRTWSTDLSMFWVSSAIPIGFTLMGIECLRQIYLSLRRRGGSQGSEVKLHPQSGWPQVAPPEGGSSLGKSR